MDTEEESRKLIMMLGVALAFVVSAFVSWSELKYALGSTETDAEFIRMYETRGRRGRVTRHVEYRYTNADGESQKDSNTVGDSFYPPADNKLRIEYLSDRSRLAGNRNYAMLLVFFGCLAALVFFGVRFWMEVREATRPRGRPVRRR